MPRKAKTKSKKEQEEKAQEAEESKPKLSQEEIASLEQMIEENESRLNSAELREFLSSDESPSPSLKKVNPPQKSQFMLERDIITGNMSVENPAQGKNNEEENGFKYLPEVQNANQPKYIQYGERIREMAQKTEIEKRDTGISFERREIILNSSMRTTPEIESFEKYTQIISPIRKSERDKEMKRRSFEKPEIKYTPEKY